MKKIVTALLSSALVCTPLLYGQPRQTGETQASPAPTSPSAPAARPAAPEERIAPGSVIPVELTKTLDAKKAKTGEAVVVKVTEDMKSNTGNVILPKDTEIVGNVTEAQPHSKQREQSQLAITFDKAVLRNGETIQMPMSIQAIIAPPSQTPDQANAGGSPSAYPGAPTGGGGVRPGIPGGAPNPAGGSAQMPPPTSIPPEQPRQQPPISSKTTGVVGIANLDLSAAPDAKQGSLVTSEKKNVKLESGTLMLLRVNQ